MFHFEFEAPEGDDAPFVDVFNQDYLPWATEKNHYLISVQSAEWSSAEHEEFIELDYKATPRELFERYLLKNTAIGYDDFQVVLTETNRDTLIAQGVVTKTTGESCWFHVGEKVTIKHNGSECWRMTSEDDDHGQGVYLGAEYGGIGIGS